ncbi:MAG: DUF2283 domain-containing protein [Dehalococcoidia bacterium]
MRLEHDQDVNAVYIYLRDLPYAFGENLDLSRRIDYASDNKPLGVELLNVHRGVNLDNLPEREAIGRLLEEHKIKVYA